LLFDTVLGLASLAKASFAKSSKEIGGSMKNKLAALGLGFSLATTAPAFAAGENRNPENNKPKNIPVKMNEAQLDRVAGGQSI
jgi:hypothetical protein